MLGIDIDLQAEFGIRIAVGRGEQWAEKAYQLEEVCVADVAKGGGDVPCRLMRVVIPRGGHASRTCRVKLLCRKSKWFGLSEDVIFEQSGTDDRRQDRCVFHKASVD